MNNQLTAILISIGLYTSCANPVSPTGGPKDIEPPLILTQSIDTTSQKHTTLIHLEFDEYYNIKNEIHYNPQTKKPSKPKITKAQKTAVIEIPKVATSYNFGNSISDLNENNIGVYPTTYIKSDTGQIQLQPQVPLYFEKDKNTLSLETNIDTLYYRSYRIQDTLYLDGLPSTDLNTNLYLDANKNNCYDSTEWFCTKPLDSIVDVFLYPPLKNRLEIDTSNGYAIVISPFYLKPVFIKPIYPGDTFIMSLKQISTWIKTLPSIVINYKKISYPVRTTQVSSIINDDTMVNWESPFPQNLLSNQTNIDTIHTTQKCGIANFSFNDSIMQVNLLIVKKGHVFLHKTINHKNDSIILPVGDYNFIAYSDLNNDGLFNSLLVPDKVYNYFEKISITPRLTNVITIGKTTQQDGNIRGKTNTKLIETLSPQNPVNTPISIPK